jgi:hypothetical protein
MMMHEIQMQWHGALASYFVQGFVVLTSLVEFAFEHLLENF